MKKYIHRFELTSPFTVSAIITLYGLLSYIFCVDPFIRAYNQKVICSPFSLSIWIILSFSIYLGGKISLNLYKISKGILFISLLAVLIAIFSVYRSFILALFAFIFLILLTYYILYYERKYERSLVIGLVIMCISLLFTGIPLLKGTHEQFILNLNPIFIGGYGIALISLVFLWPRYKPIWILFILFSIFTTYRAFIAFPVIAFIFLYLESREKIWRKTKFLTRDKIFLFSIILLFLILILTSEYFVRTSFQTSWELGILRSAEYRAASTFSIFDIIISKSFPFGYSPMVTLFSSNTGKLICEIAYSCSSTINAGIFAPFFIDMGILSFIVFLLIGKILRDLYEKNFKFYAFASSLLISSLDIGVSIYFLSLLTILWVRGIEKKDT